MIDKICQICGSIFQVKPYRAKSANFCSRKCSGKSPNNYFKSKKVDRSHLKGNKFRLGKPPANKGKESLFKGNKSPSWVEPISFTCIHCDSVFYRKPWETRGNGRKNLFCCFDCKCNYFRDNLSGENNPQYVGGDLTYRGRGWKRARKLAVERDSGICQDCNKYIGDSISVHHITPFRDFDSEKEANDINNLICYCQSCHMKREPRPNKKQE